MKIGEKHLLLDFRVVADGVGSLEAVLDRELLSVLVRNYDANVMLVARVLHGLPKDRVGHELVEVILKVVLRFGALTCAHVDPRRQELLLPEGDCPV